MLRFLFFVSLFFIAYPLSGNGGGPNDNLRKTINIKKSKAPLKLDGVLDDDTWRAEIIHTDFWMKFPTNDTIASPKTEIQVTYDEKFIYFGVKVFESQDRILVQSLKRDQGLRAGDGIGIVLDPVNLKTNGFYFSVNPFNSQTEGLIGNTLEEVSFTWDNTWYSQTKRYDDFWTAELAIPFSILRYDENKKVWGINFIRSARVENEFHSWTQIPLQFTGTDLGYVGQMVWDANPPMGGSKLAVNPYIKTDLAADKENKQPTKGNISAGVDAKIALSSSLNLDLTANPDFSNTDVDVQVTNLTRFSIFFPERRVFFLENDDLFSNFGLEPVRPFYSRRIGSKNGSNVPILFGARLTGNLNKDLRIGVMSIQTGRKDASAADNFTTITFNHKILERSVVKGYFTNRTGFQNEMEKKTDPLGAYGRNAGLEYGYTSKSGTIQAWGSGNLSMKPGITDKNFFVNSGGGYFGQNFTCFVDYTSVKRNYYADAGFVNRIENYDAISNTINRVGYSHLYNEIVYDYYPKSGLLNKFTVGAENYFAIDDANHFNERSNNFYTNFSFRNASNISVSFGSNDINLLFPFSFIEDDENAEPLPAQRYAFNSVALAFSTDARRNLVFSGGTTLGKLYSADYQQYFATLTLRRQPFVSCAIRAEYNNLVFPSPYGSQKYLLIAPQIEVNFANNFFWTSFLQYNSQANNFNINSRIQWRYKPMSDIFLVYSDNYFTDPVLQNKNRAIVFKTNYWLNL